MKQPPHRDEELFDLWLEAVHCECWIERITILQRWQDRLRALQGGRKAGSWNKKPDALTEDK